MKVMFSALQGDSMRITKKMRIFAAHTGAELVLTAGKTGM